MRLVLLGLGLAVMASGIATAIPKLAVAADQQISVATLIERLHQTAPDKTPLSRSLVRKSCSKDCVMSSGATTRNDNQSYDCAYNRQPICECR
jgi:hypothetical protein